MISVETSLIILLASSFIGLLWAIINAIFLSKIKLTGSQPNFEYNKFQEEHH